VRLDKLLPFYDGDGEQHYVQAFQACITLMAAGDMAAARARAGDFPEEVRRRLAQEPDNWALLLYGTGYALILGRDEEALRLARHAVEILPESRDAVDGPVCSLVLAYAHSWTGHKDEAIEELRHLFRVPVTNSFNVHDLAANPFFTPLHGDPRFEALLADPANNAPLY